jgi:acyl-coenzyme A synthetase/AMP-(fatty) acid ligase
MGASIIFHQGENYHRSLLIDGITHAFCTPEKLSHILAAPSAEIRRNPDLRLFAIGAPLTPALASAAEAALTPQIFTLIASTEAGPWALTRIEHAEDLRSHSIHPSVEVEIVDSADQVLPPGQMGAIRIRTPECIPGYLDDDAASREIFRNGCFYPGDLGELRADGRLVLHGRASNVINLAGIKMAVEPVEQLLQDSLGADTVCLLSLRGESGDDELHAIVQSQHEIGHANVAELIHASLRGFNLAHVHFIETIPRNEMGKIDRLVLRKQISALRAGLEI